MDEQFLKGMSGEDKRARCCWCCERGPVILRAQLQRSAYACGEAIRLRAFIDNEGDEPVR